MAPFHGNIVTSGGRFFLARNWHVVMCCTWVVSHENYWLDTVAAPTVLFGVIGGGRCHRDS